MRHRNRAAQQIPESEPFLLLFRLRLLLRLRLVRLVVRCHSAAHNHERAAEETAGKVHWLRPDYQQPRFEAKKD